MKKHLNAYIDKYIQDADEPDKKVARHLKEIIPKTTHVDKNILDEIVELLKKEMENDREKDFKNVFLNVCRKYILKGDIIAAELPKVLTRIILDESKFTEKIAKEKAIPLNRNEIKEIVDSGNKEDITDLFGDLRLALRKVVFATFDEDEPETDPFTNFKINDIIDMLALNYDRNFKKKQPLTAVSIRYKNQDHLLKRFPFFPDAGWYDKFHPSEKADKYGRTKNTTASLKCMPEIVHENIKLADVIEDIRFFEE